MNPFIAPTYETFKDALLEHSSLGGVTALEEVLGAKPPSFRTKTESYLLSYVNRGDR